MSVGKDGRVVVNNHVHVRQFEGEMVLLHLERGDYFGLDDLGARVWHGLAAGQSPSEIAAALAGDHDVDPARMLADFVALADELVLRGLVAPVDPHAELAAKDGPK